MNSELGTKNGNIKEFCCRKCILVYEWATSGGWIVVHVLFSYKYFIYHLLHLFLRLCVCYLRIIVYNIQYMYYKGSKVQFWVQFFILTFIEIITLYTMNQIVLYATGSREQTEKIESQFSIMANGVAKQTVFL